MEWQEIPASDFVWDKYIGKVGFAVHQCFHDAYVIPLRMNSELKSCQSFQRHHNGGAMITNIAPKGHHNG